MIGDGAATLPAVVVGGTGSSAALLDAWLWSVFGAHSCRDRAAEDATFVVAEHLGRHHAFDTQNPPSSRRADLSRINTTVTAFITVPETTGRKDKTEFFTGSIRHEWETV